MTAVQASAERRLTPVDAGRVFFGWMFVLIVAAALVLVARILPESEVVANVAAIVVGLAIVPLLSSRSGEIDVLVGEQPAVVRSTLLLRQLGPDDGWFVIGSVNPHMTIESPSSRSVVPAGKLIVSGVARGFEAQVSVTAYVAGDARQVISQRYALAGSAEASEPYAVELDLSSAESGSVVMIVVKGGVGLETDPGEFSVIPVMIA